MTGLHAGCMVMPVVRDKLLLCCVQTEIAMDEHGSKGYVYTDLCTLRQKKQLVRPLRKSMGYCLTARKCKFILG